jgi:nucleolin
VANITHASHPANGKRKANDVEAEAPKKQKLENGDAAPAGQSMGIFVGGLSWNVDNDQLQQFFAECGEVTSARVQMDRNTGKSRGFGYVDFSSNDAVEAALALNGSEFDGRTIKVDRSTSKFDAKGAMEKRQKDFGNAPSEPTPTLFVGNLSWSTTEDGLWEIFGEHGEVKSVRLPTDRETGKPKGFGYIEFTELDGAKKAYGAMQGQDIEGRAIRLDYSQPRDNSGGGRGGFGGDRGGGRGGRGGGFGERGGGFGGDRGGRGGGRGGFGGRGGGRGGGDSGWVRTHVVPYLTRR